MRWLAIIIVALAVAGPAAADPRAEAEQFYRIGEKAYKKQDYANAARNFDEAYTRLALPDIAFSAAQAHRLQYYVDRKAERVSRAIELYRAYLAVVKDGGRVGDASTSLAELERIQRDFDPRDLADPAPVVIERPPSLMISVEPDHANATVTVDGVPARLVDDLVVEPGEHDIHAEADGYFSRDKKVRAVPNTVVPIEIELKPRPGLLDVRGERGAAVSVDGRYVGLLPLRPIDVVAGEHVVAVTRRGRRPWTKEVDVGRGETEHLAADLDVTTQRTVARWTLGASVAVAVGGVVVGSLAVKAGHDADDLDEQRKDTYITEADLKRYDGLVGDRDRYRAISGALIGLAVAGAATGALLFWFDTSEAAAPITPVVTSDAVGVAITTDF